MALVLGRKRPSKKHDKEALHTKGHITTLQGIKIPQAACHHQGMKVN